VFTIVVPIKRVASLDDAFELNELEVRVDPSFLEYELNEWDLCSVEAAVQIKEAVVDAEVVVVTVGDEACEEALRACLAMGADRAIRVWDQHAFCDPEPLTVANALAAAIRRSDASLVLCGVQSSDAGSGATGIALAGILDLPHTAVVRALDLRVSERELFVDRELEGGVVEEVRLPVPALVTVQTGTNEPRYATLRAIKQASAKPLELLRLEDVGLSAEDLEAARGSRTVSLSLPPKEGNGPQLLEGDATAIATRIAAILQDALNAGASA
jgi:electron transfer flavoprotein beta subunit